MSGLLACSNDFIGPWSNPMGAAVSLLVSSYLFPHLPDTSTQNSYAPPPPSHPRAWSRFYPPAVAFPSSCRRVSSSFADPGSGSWFGRAFRQPKFRSGRLHAGSLHLSPSPGAACWSSPGSGVERGAWGGRERERGGEIELYTVDSHRGFWWREARTTWDGTDRAERTHQI